MKEARVCCVLLAGGLALVASGCAGSEAVTDGAADPEVGDPAPDAAADPLDDVAEETAAGDVDLDPTPDGQDAAEAVDAAADEEAEAAAGVTCETVGEGWNRGFLVDGLPRDFILDLPAGAATGGPWPVIFNFHGLGDTAENMSRLLSGSVDDSTFPFILVTPEDTNYAIMGMVNIDWDVAVVTTANKEARLFDEVLACLESRFGVDESHVHAVGFSMGGFVTDMLGTVRGEQMASLVTYSGAYGSDTANLSGLLASVVSWPSDVVANKYVQVFLHGGTTDTYSLGVQTVHFDQIAQNDVAFLNGRGHDAVICNHGGGHSVPSGFRARQLLEFFAAHPLGTTDSPFSTAFPAGYPGYCAFSPKSL